MQHFGFRGYLSRSQHQCLITLPKERDQISTFSEIISYVLFTNAHNFTFYEQSTTTNVDSVDYAAGAVPETLQGRQRADPGSLSDSSVVGNDHANGNSNDEDDPDEQPYVNSAGVDEIHIAQLFIDALCNASIHNGDISPDDVDLLLNPAENPLEFDEHEDKDLLLCLRLFIAHTLAPRQTYMDTVNAIQIAHPENNTLSYDQVKRRVANLTGVKPIKDDMCINSCMAFTGPYLEKDACYRCGEPWFEPGTRKARQKFFSIPLAPQVQALRRHDKTARDMQYFWQRTQELLREHDGPDGIQVLNDICCGTDVLAAVHNGDIGEHDTILMMSFDGAQIYRNKTSDCWIYIWIIVNLSPDRRYKKKYVIPSGIIPGPNKPKIVESFLFPGLHHIAAVNKLPGGGLPVWDANLDAKYISRFYVILATADGPGMVYLNGLVGHSGKIGCRLWCGLVGRHKPGKPTYYPALNKPENYDVEGCNHPDVPVHIVHPINADRVTTKSGDAKLAFVNQVYSPAFLLVHISAFQICSLATLCI
ncbi:hypothetical protein Hypma_001773 [Hypsizygus marmoreus]|uniref:Uncharacterized protein n=1 Tax=Hypsizygus marmoreus TaxID=39966 RepID=A0A369J6N3_HYPMA|nr:hypothetical protein Hypma_001773 [Hypsizygus marmoreus]